MRRHEDPTQERKQRIATLRQQIHALYALAKEQGRELNEQEQHQAEHYSKQIAEALNEEFDF